MSAGGQKPRTTQRSGVENALAGQDLHPGLPEALAQNQHSNRPKLPHKASVTPTRSSRLQTSLHPTSNASHNALSHITPREKTRDSEAQWTTCKENRKKQLTTIKLRTI